MSAEARGPVATRAPWRVGVLYPGHAAEDDYPALARRLAPTGVVDVVHTPMAVDHHGVEALLDVGRDESLLAGVEQLRGTAPDAVAWACTSGSFVYGWDGAHQQVDLLERELACPATTTAVAFVAAAEHLDARRVVVAATYPDALAHHFVAFLARAGVEVLHIDTAGILTAAAVGQLGHDDVTALVDAARHEDAEAVLVPDTALRTVPWLFELETRAGMPVLTANQVTVWHALRRAGITVTGERLGRLLSPEGRTGARARS